MNVRPLPLIAMRQQHNNARHPQPLCFRRRDKLINNNLSAVGEITELSFPHDQRIWLNQANAVFEPQTPASERGLLWATKRDCPQKYSPVGRSSLQSPDRSDKNAAVKMFHAAHPVRQVGPDVLPAPDCQMPEASPVDQSMPSPVSIIFAGYQ